MRFSQSYNLNAVTHAPECIKSRNSDHRSWYRFFFAFEVKKKIPYYFPGRLLRAARDKQEEKVEGKKKEQSQNAVAMLGKMRLEAIVK